MQSICSICEKSWERQSKFVKPGHPFVCRMCRCEDCQIVLNYTCKAPNCGNIHGIPNETGSKVCCDCVIVRARVIDLDESIQTIRQLEITEEEPLYQ